jgi:starvation-inducible DNA-binding protein
MKLDAHRLHFNATGPHFYSRHAMFQEIYEELEAAFDEVGEQIRMQGMRVKLYMTEQRDYIEETDSSIQEVADKYSTLFSEDLKDVYRLFVANKVVTQDVEHAHAIAEELGLTALSHFLEGRLGAHEMHEYMLKSHLEA